ncbi:MAG: GFA family protein [Rhodospirillales bacterium]|nr:GFA family protein [Rhodospirillales bacterium]
MTETHEGGCQCGRVRYRTSGKPNNTTNCHCTQCRMAAGAVYVTWSEYPAEAVTFTTQRPQYFRSSDAAERGFCPSCGTALTFCYFDGDTIDIATATLDDPGVFTPGDHLWIDDKVAWVNINDGLPQYPRERGST